MADLDVRFDRRPENFHRVPAGQDPMTIFRAAVETGVQVRHFVRSQTSLEDIFARTVGVD